MKNTDDAMSDGASADAEVGGEWVFVYRCLLCGAVARTFDRLCVSMSGLDWHMRTEKGVYVPGTSHDCSDEARGAVMFVGSDTRESHDWRGGSVIAVKP